MLNLNNLKKLEWYRQETEANPYFAYAPCCGCVTFFKRKEGIIWYCTQDNARAYLSKECLRKMAEEYLQKEKKKHGSLDALFKDWETNVKLINSKIFTSVNKKELTNLSNKELLALNKELAEQSFVMWTKFFMDIFDLDAESLVEQELVEAKIVLKDDERKIMMTQEKMLNHQRAERDLLKIVNLIKSTDSAVNTFTYITSPSNLHRLKLYPAIEKALCEYQKNYFWIYNSWGVTKVAGVFEFVELIKQILAGPRNSTQEFEELNNFEKNINQQKKAIADKHKMSPWLKQMFHFFALLGFWRDERKMQVQLMNHYFEVLGREIAKRSRLDWNVLKLCDSRAIQEIPVPHKLIEESKTFFSEQYVIVWDKNKVVHLDKKECKQVIDIIEKSMQIGVKELMGIIACPGKAKGKVRIIIKSSEFNKMEKGDILVTPMTRPDYIPLMKKAAAIITDEGGITSHAAVISRELKVPCIIGTQVASKMLKDGMIVEVNANHGTIRILDDKSK